MPGGSPIRRRGPRAPGPQRWAGFIGSRGTGRLLEGIEYFQQAIAREPKYAMTRRIGGLTFVAECELMPPLPFKARKGQAILRTRIDDSW
jgi:hypothetical protein